MFQHIIHKLRSLRVLRVSRSVIVGAGGHVDVCFMRCDVDVNLSVGGSKCVSVKYSVKNIVERRGVLNI